MKNPFENHGAFSWSELVTSDPTAAKEFYSSLLGWEIEDVPMGDQGTYSIVKAADGESVGGLMQLPKNCPAPAWGVYITVDDVDAVAKKAEEIGGKIIVPIMDVPEVGRFCWIQDPQGAVFGVITYVKS